MVTKEEYKEKHKKTLMVCDIIFIIAIICNIGAACITNIMVVKNHPDVKFYEGNPVTRENMDYATPPDNVSEVDGKKVSEKFRGFIIQMLLYLILFFGYMSIRFYVSSDFQLVLLLTITLFLFYALCFDFSSNLGYYIGVKIYG